MSPVCGCFLDDCYQDAIKLQIVVLGLQVFPGGTTAVQVEKKTDDLSENILFVLVVISIFPVNSPEC